MKTDRKRIEELYTSGLGATTVARMLGVTKKTIYNALKEQGVKTKPHGPYRKPVWDEALDVLTPEALYWCGVLAADGCVYKNKLILVLQERDRAHVEKFRSFLRSGCKLSDVLAPCPSGAVWPAVRLAVTSTRLTDRLRVLGIKDRKSKNETDPVAPELAASPDFWRGLIDGDGCLHTERQMVLECLGPKPVMDQLALYVQHFTHGYLPTITKNTGCWKCAMFGEAAYKVLVHLYSDAPPGLVLERKKAKALRLMEVFGGRVWRKQVKQQEEPG